MISNHLAQLLNIWKMFTFKTICRGCLASIYFFQDNNSNTRTMREICSKLTIKHHSDISGVILVSLLLTCWLWIKIYRLELAFAMSCVSIRQTIFSPCLCVDWFFNFLFVLYFNVNNFFFSLYLKPLHEDMVTLIVCHQ